MITGLGEEEGDRIVAGDPVRLPGLRRRLAIRPGWATAGIGQSAALADSKPDTMSRSSRVIVSWRRWR